MPKVDFGPMTTDQTCEVITEGLAMLTLEQKLDVIIESLGDDEKQELLIRLYDELPSGDDPTNA